MYWLYLYNEIHNFLSNSHVWISYLDSSGLRGMEYTPSPCWGLWHCCTFQLDMTSSRILFHWDSSSPRDRQSWRTQHFLRWSELAHSRILSNIMKIIVGNSFTKSICEILIDVQDTETINPQLTLTFRADSAGCGTIVVCMGTSWTVLGQGAPCGAVLGSRTDDFCLQTGSWGTVISWNGKSEIHPHIITYVHDCNPTTILHSRNLLHIW